MRKQELHLDSSLDGHDNTNRNVLKCCLSSPLYLRKYSVRTVQVPYTMNNIYETNRIVFTFKFNAPAEFSDTFDVPPALYTAASLIQYFNDNSTVSALATQVYSLSATGKLRVQVTYTGAPANAGDFVTIAWPNVTISPATYQLQKLMGFGVTAGITINSAKNLTSSNTPTYTFFDSAFRFSAPLYLMLRSDSLGSGHVFLPVSRGQRQEFPKTNSSSSNIIAKIPLEQDAALYSYKTFINDYHAEESMMTVYNGSEVNTIDFYFTYPHSESIVDFNGYPFTIGIDYLTDREAAL